MRARLSLIFAAMLALLGFVVPATSADAAPVGYPVTICATLSVSTTTPLVGASITVSGVNFDPNATIKLELEAKPWLLATVKSNAQGGFTVTVKLPAGVVGAHLIVAIGGNTQSGASCPADPSQLLHIQGLGGGGQTGGGGTGSNGGGTAFTGVDVLLLVLLAAALLTVGVAVNRSGKRRKHAEAEWYLT